MKKYILFIVFAFICTVGYADEIKIPFSCWPKELKKAFAEQGKKLDLNGSKRTNDSWGYILNRGSEYTIYTYQSVSSEDFALIQKIVLAVDGEK